MNRSLRTLLALSVVAIAPVLSGTHVTQAQTGDKSPISAFATCFDATASDPAQVEVAIDNNSGRSIVVSYVHGYTTGLELDPEFGLHAPGTTPTYEVEDGDRFWVWAPADDLREAVGDTIEVLVVTNLGPILVDCSGEPRDLIETASYGDGSTIGDPETQAAIAIETIGRLEGWHAYPALYALMHPDAQAVVPFEAMACWYVGQNGTADEWKNVVFTTEADSVRFDSWTYPVTGEIYTDAAEVDFTQKVGALTDQRLVSATNHLVPYQGQYRWFFGLNAAEVAAMPSDCDLGQN